MKSETGWEKEIVDFGLMQYSADPVLSESCTW